MWLSRCPANADASLLATSLMTCSGMSQAPDGVLPLTVFVADGFCRRIRRRFLPRHAGKSVRLVKRRPVPGVVVPSALGGRFFRAAESTATLLCRMSAPSFNGTLGIASVPLSVEPTFGPSGTTPFRSVVQVSCGSARLGISVNATDALIGLASLQPGSCSGGGGAFIGSCLLADALQSPEVVLAAAQLIWAGTPLPNASTSTTAGAPLHA